MTVCAAAICTVGEGTGRQDVLLCASDRMLTSGDIEFESPTTKVFGFSPLPVVGLSAGDSDLNFMIATETHRSVIAGEVTDVEGVARLFAKNVGTLRRDLAEKLHLAPLGLDLDAFMSRQQEMEPDLAFALAEALQNENLEVESLIVGADTTGVHIYHVPEPGAALCRDRSGFFAIGSGSRQFETLFMSLRYSRRWALKDALLLMYSAKRRAEVSPGVGPATDICLLTQNGTLYVPQQPIEALGRCYDELEEMAKRGREQAVAKLVREDVFLRCFTEAAKSPDTP